MASVNVIYWVSKTYSQFFMGNEWLFLFQSLFSKLQMANIIPFLEIGIYDQAPW